MLLKSNDRTNQHLDALIFVVANNHMYLLSDKAQREKIFKASPSVAKRKVGKVVEVKKEMKVLVDPAEIPKEPHTIVMTKPGAVGKHFYSLLENRICCNKSLYVRDEGVSSFVDQHGNLLYQNSDHYAVQEVIARIQQPASDQDRS